MTGLWDIDRINLYYGEIINFEGINTAIYCQTLKLDFNSPFICINKHFSSPIVDTYDHFAKTIKVMCLKKSTDFRPIVKFKLFVGLVNLGTLRMGSIRIYCRPNDPGSLCSIQ